ncbi:hypothetical protein J3R82DRAFT_8287 [Butyriboletus roseoflavus]|nr:hypothetical protein J3R82DRAFT_8287 [Butyriboletus roseoflavus]
MGSAKRGTTCLSLRYAVLWEKSEVRRSRKFVSSSAPMKAILTAHRSDPYHSHLGSRVVSVLSCHPEQNRLLTIKYPFRTVSSFKALKLAQSDDFPKLAPLAIAQGATYAVACAFQTYGLIAATMSDLITECQQIAQTGSIGSVFGVWGSNPPTNLDASQAVQFCDNEWNRDSWAEIISLIFAIVLGLFFTSIAFGYYRQLRDPTSPANSSRLPSNQARRDGHPTHYNPPYDGTAYVPVYLPPPGPPPMDGKPPEYKPGSYLSFGGDKNAKEDDPFSDYDGPSVPMPTHWVEDREVASPPRA